MKTVIKSTAANRATIKYECAISHEIYEHEFTAPINGGYVRFADGSQVCETLRVRGNTLMWSSELPLICLIRREYRAMRRSEQAELRRAGF